MKKILLICLMGILSFESVVFADGKHNEKLKKAYVKLYHASGLPIKVDELTSITDVESANNDSVVYYTYKIDMDGLLKLIQKQNPQITHFSKKFTNTLKKFANKALIADDCRPGSTELNLLKSGISFDYKYYSAQTKNEIFHFIRTIDDCK